MGYPPTVVFPQTSGFWLSDSAPEFVASAFQSHQGSRSLDRKGPRVLVVDDEKLVADSLAEILKRFNFDAIAFYSGEDAIEFARQQCPDVVLSDVMMPQINGVETVLKIRELCPHTRVLLLSGHAATADVLREAESEGHRFELLAKPIHPDELLRRLQ
jgi:CheY-like chemotaxis protein